jgi:hypothetical protein
MRGRAHLEVEPRFGRQDGAWAMHGGAGGLYGGRRAGWMCHTLNQGKWHGRALIVAADSSRHERTAWLAASVFMSKRDTMDTVARPGCSETRGSMHELLLAWPKPNTQNSRAFVVACLIKRT